MTATATALNVNKQTARQLFARKRMINLGLPVLVAFYLGYIFFAFDVPGLLARADSENARTLVADSYSYKTHVTRDNRSGDISVAIEGERKGSYPDGTAPAWVTLAPETGGDTRIDLGTGHLVTLGADNFVAFDIPGYGRITAQPSRARGVNATFPDGPLPDWINASKNRLAVTTDAGRLSVTRNQTQVFKYALGWELFFFTLDSPYHGLPVSEVAARAVSGEAAAIWAEFWNNKMWRHADVAWALFETVLMAFLGTMGAAIVALPMAFMAARNFAPFVALRFAVRRVFDFFRGVDALIWTIILSRAFGPGPLTGALAILITDTGTFGKLFSEALENVDGKQIEGIQSTGAKPLQRYRFGVIPQITPVLLSQVLYYLESNTRSATIIGAITGGGIGLLLTQAMITQKDWEEVTYYISLVILMVMAMDSLSGWLRGKLIGSREDQH
ncbi:phosphonate ABC transporter, permease protein PhnE [Cognatishimia sp. SS12]|uniref:phosphonate ABC transporter, permease protein PhnE n=1 Tax=Cognatishimia sp. SS12 TaxID=2979465 RepID=UPI00232D424A|nr:phosphonate ABC transporter, permease protein PhnE [Cognatishimia sp. SS12]MDC0738693.1 phosphonate ABC transporter, permease protein PhnE [Cognatishimia sp. SS12]